MRGSYADLHEMLDHLTPDQAEAIRVVIHQFPPPSTQANGGAERRLSFIGLIPDGPSDLAERSEEIIRARFETS